MAASCACYAAAADMPCYVLVPETVAMAKLAQVVAYGGQIIKVKGSYNDAADLAYQLAKQRSFYLAGDYAFRVEGQKTAAFEIVEQLHHREPDVVMVPIGCGTNISAYHKGFAEYQQLGFIQKIPRLYGVQASGACAVVDGFQQGEQQVKVLPNCNTVASAIAVLDPIDGNKALAAIRATDGAAYAISDDEILAAQSLLAAEEGLFVETASASVLACLLAQSERLANKTVVCVLTGDGLKDANVLMQAAARAPCIDATVAAFSDTLFKDG